MTPEQFGQVVVGHLQGWLRALQEADAAEARKAEEIAAQGFRLVNGGQISGWVDGRTQVEYTDARTGEVLFEGQVTEPDEGWDEAWFHSDRLHDDLPLPDHPVDESLPQPVQRFLSGLSEASLEMEASGLRALLGEVTR
jgi:hypothetical protein